MGFLGTVSWMIPAMLVVALIGFFTARDIIAPNYLQPSKVQGDRIKPVRILSPEEALTAERDVTSPVWENGVDKDDIPKMESNRRRSSRSRRHRETAQPTQEEHRATTPAPEAPTPPASNDTAAPASPSPAPDGGGDTVVTPD